MNNKKRKNFCKSTYASIKGILFLMLLIISLCFYPACNDNVETNRENFDRNKKIEYSKTIADISILEKEDFISEIYSNGKIFSSEITDIYIGEGGEITEMDLFEGQYVKKGQHLVSVNSFAMQLELKKAEINIINAQNSYQSMLIAQGYDMKKLENIPENIIKKAYVKSTLAMCEVNLKEAKLRLEKTAVYAPFKGIVANVNKKKYNIVSAQDKICTLINNAKYEVVFSVFEQQINDILLHKKIFVISSLQDTILAEIKEINPLVEKGQFRVTASIPEKYTNQVKQGMNVKITVRSRRKNSLAILKSALVTRQNKDVVFTLKNGKATWNYVTVTEENETQYRIGQGLNEGDSVINSDNMNITDGTQVIKRKND